MKWKPSLNDKIPVIALKNTLTSLLFPLSILFTCCFVSGDFPKHFKQAIVIPIYKGKGPKTDPDNYRPIAMLPNLSKLLEYVINRKILNHVESRNMLDEHQHGFRTGRSCATAVSVFSQNVFEALDKPNNFVIVVFFDAKKAFNSILHTLLISDLINIFNLSYGIVALVIGFLSNRSFCIKIGNFMSKSFEESRGIGQGTVNGPLFYILFFDKVKSILSDCMYSIFADDLAVYISDTDPVRGIDRMQVILERLDNFCKSIGINMSYDKTKMMIIRKPQSKKFVSKQLVCNGHHIECVSSFKYLGVIIDEYFSFKEHSASVLSKISVNAGLIIKLRKFLSPHMLMLLVNSYINSVTDYCLPIWGPSRSGDFPQIQNVTNNLLASFYFPSIMKFKTKRNWSNLSPLGLNQMKKSCILAHKQIDYYGLLEKCNLFTITERLQFQSVWNVFRIKRFGCKVLFLNNVFNGAAQANQARSSRSRHPCPIVAHKTKIFENSLVYYSSSLWNKLPDECRDLDNIKLNFKGLVTLWLLNKRSDVFVK